MSSMHLLGRSRSVLCSLCKRNSKVQVVLIATLRTGIAQLSSDGGCLLKQRLQPKYGLICSAFRERAITGFQNGRGLSFTRLHQLRKLHSAAVIQQKRVSDIDKRLEDELAEDSSEESVLEETKHREFLREYYSIPESGQRLLIIQPEIRWGPKKSGITTAELQLAEACALVDSLPDWKVVEKNVCKTKSLSTRYIFGRGTLEELTAKVRSRTDVSAVFISINMMTGAQLTTLQRCWGVPIFDRYTVVLEIFKEHAKTKEAKLQVALAEIPYLRSRLKEIHEGTVNRSTGGMQYLGGSGETYLELRHRLLQVRELKLRRALEKVKNQRKMLRESRARREYPVVAVVGYTNSGKTSLIKALTGDGSLVPEDQLFATLDVTAHAGTLPSHMTVLYMDTVGFLSDIPTSLIEAFSATLEDAMVADAVIHVRDVSHPDTRAQRHNVLTTLKTMLSPDQLGRVIEVCNKADLLTLPPDSQVTLISAKTGLGLRELQQTVEKAVMEQTDKAIRHMKVPMAGPHLSWLYKESTVKSCVPTADGEHLVVEVIISQAAHARFRARFARGKRTLKTKAGM